MSKEKQPTKKDVKPPSYSSEDDEPASIAEQAEAKRIQNEIKKKTLASQALKVKAKPPPPMPPSTGGKAPPAIVKQHQQMCKSAAAAAAAAHKNRDSTDSRPNKGLKSKLKTLFALSNSSESEDERTSKKASPAKTKSAAPRGRPPKVKPDDRPASRKSSQSSSITSTDSTSSR